MQPLFGTQLKFILSGPLERVIRWQRKFVVQELVCISNEAAVISVLEINVDVSRQRPIFVPNHGGAM